MKKIILTLFLSLMLSFSAFSIAAVNIHTATQAELETLKGIGPNKAQAIIKYRKKHGKFKSASDLQAVDGIGQKTVKNIGRNASTSGKTSIKKAKKADVKKIKKGKSKSSKKS